MRQMDSNRPKVLTAGGAKKRVPPAESASPGFAVPPQEKSTKAVAILSQEESAATNTKPTTGPLQQDSQNTPERPGLLSLEYESSEHFEDDDQPREAYSDNPHARPYSDNLRSSPQQQGSDQFTPDGETSDADLVSPLDPAASAAMSIKSHQRHELYWLFICFMGIMASFVCYGLLLEYATSGDEKLHELSFLFLTSGLYTLTAAAGRYVRDETPTTIPPARFAILGLTSMGSTFFFCSISEICHLSHPGARQKLQASSSDAYGCTYGKVIPSEKVFECGYDCFGCSPFHGRGWFR